MSYRSLQVNYLYSVKCRHEMVSWCLECLSLIRPQCLVLQAHFFNSRGSFKSVIGQVCTALHVVHAVSLVFTPHWLIISSNSLSSQYTNVSPAAACAVRVNKSSPPLKLFVIFSLVLNLCNWKLPWLLPKHIPMFTPILVHLSEYLYELYHFFLVRPLKF